jgi:hypothetical protein
MQNTGTEANVESSTDNHVTSKREGDKRCNIYLLSSKGGKKCREFSLIMKMITPNLETNAAFLCFEVR